MRVVIETEGGPDVGLGHVYRSVALAKALTDAGATTHVDVSGESALSVVQDGKVQLSDHGTYDAAVCDLPPGSSPQREVCLEVVDERFEARHPLYSLASFDGPPFDHAILRPQFTPIDGGRCEARRGTVLVALGGVDPTSSTPRIVKGLMDAGLDVVGVVGVGSRDRNGFEPSTSIWYEMVMAEVVVASGGMTILEAAALGKPVFAVSHNAREHARLVRIEAQAPHWLRYSGPAPGVEMGRMSSAIRGLIDSPRALARASAAARAQVDGYGAMRAANRVLTLAHHRSQEHRVMRIGS